MWYCVRGAWRWLVNEHKISKKNFIKYVILCTKFMLQCSLSHEFHKLEVKCLFTRDSARTWNIRISYAELSNTYVELRMNIRNICRFYAELCKEFRTCGISSTSVIGKISASMWQICGEFGLSFFTMRKNAEIINLNKFCSGKYLRKISSAEILDLDNFTSGKYQRKLISPDHKWIFSFFFWLNKTTVLCKFSFCHDFLNLSVQSC